MHLRMVMTYRVDDEMCTGLRTRIAELRPVEVIVERGRLSESTRKVLRAGLRSPRMNELNQFWSAGQTVQEILRAGYFREQPGLCLLPVMKPCVGFKQHSKQPDMHICASGAGHCGIAFCARRLVCPIVSACLQHLYKL